MTPPEALHQAPTLEAMRSDEFRPKRSIWPGLLIAGVIAVGAAAVVMTVIDEDSAPVASAVAPGATVTAAPGAASPAADDAAITVAVKTALAADPALAGVKIDVTTRQGAVLLEGPAPDEGSRQRAEVLAAAPTGVSRVDNNLVVAASTATPTVSAAPVSR